MLIIGVDAHKRVHAAVAVDGAGQAVGDWRGPNDPDGWQALAVWAAQLGPVERWGIEGAGQYGRGLAQALVASGAVVHEVNPRQTAAMRRGGRQRGKSDRLDAQAVARVVCQEGTALPCIQPEDATAALAVLVAERDAALTEATRIRNQLHQVLTQLDPTYEQLYPDLTRLETVEGLQHYVAPLPGATAATRAGTVRRLATRLVLALEQAATIKTEIEALAVVHLQPLLALCGVGPLTAGMLAAYLGPGGRFASDAQLAMFAGVAPLEASSGEVTRHRLNRSGHRQLNAVLHRIVLTQARCHLPAQRYLARRMAEGKSELEAKRALKRDVARAVFRLWQQCAACLSAATSPAAA